MTVLLFFFICYSLIGLLLIGWMALMIQKRTLPFSRNNLIGLIVTGIFWLPILIYSIITNEN
jgi:heme/copper-type cytochrome/quinol oxidase subunit 1